MYFICISFQNANSHLHKQIYISSDYDNEYLDRMRLLGFYIPILAGVDSSYLPARCYWSHNMLHKDIERTLNSKLTSCSLARLRGWGFERGEVVETFEELQAHIALHPTVGCWIVKKPHATSGVGQKRFRPSQLSLSLLMPYLDGRPVLLEPFYNRLVDIGTTFVITGKIPILFFFLFSL